MGRPTGPDSKTIDGIKFLSMRRVSEELRLDRTWASNVVGMLEEMDTPFRVEKEHASTGKVTRVWVQAEAVEALKDPIFYKDVCARRSAKQVAKRLSRGRTVEMLHMRCVRLEERVDQLEALLEPQPKQKPKPKRR